MEYNIPKATVYIPVYNYAKYLKQAIESVLTQTYKEWEMIVINDGSEDETEDILKTYESTPNVTIVNQENRGLPVTCNIALRLAKGKYIIRLDADDYLDVNALLIMVNYLEQNPDIGLVYPDYYTMDEHGEVIALERREKINDDKIWIPDLPPHGAGTMFRKKILIELGGYDETISCQDGYDIWLRFIDSYKADNVNLPLFYYRKHGENLTNNHKRILDTRQTIKEKYADIKRKKENGTEKNRIAIIPARRHSNVYDRMALVKIAGKRMIDYTLDEAIASDCFNTIVVVSEDKIILNDVQNRYSNIYTIERPIEYARRNSELEKTIQLVLDSIKMDLGEEFDEIMLLSIQAPLKRKEHMRKAIDSLYIFEYDSVKSVCETNSPYYTRTENGIQQIVSGERFRLERKAIYKGNGSLLLFKTENLQTGTSSGEKVGHIIMLREDSINICSDYDFQVAELFLEKRNAESIENI